MKPAGLPGKITPHSLTLPARLSLEDWAHCLGLLGNMAEGVSWWIADALNFGEDHFGEKMAQHVELLGLTPKTVLNIMAVGRALPPARRHEALTFGHHDAVSRLEPDDQDHWLDLAEAGEKLPNGETRPWSVSRLRAAIRALGTGEDGPESPPAARSVPVLSEGREFDVRWAEDGLVRYVVLVVRPAAGGLDVEVVARRVLRSPDVGSAENA